MIRILFILLFALSYSSVSILAQEEQTGVVQQGAKYIELNFQALAKYEQRISRQQAKMLCKLQRQERRLTARLKRTDSTAYARLQSQHLTYDSITTIAKANTGKNIQRFSQKRHPVIDTLKGIYNFLQSQAGNVNNTEVTGNRNELSELQGKLNYQQYINELISQRTNALQSISGNNLGILKSIQKQVFYGKAKMKAYQQMAEDPGKLEEKALEYLQGQLDFEQAITQSTQTGGMQGMNNASPEDLEKMGYQTKRQVTQRLQQQLGDQYGNMQQQVGGQVQDWQQNRTVNSIKNTTDNIRETRNSLQQNQQAIGQLRNDGRQPLFKVNPMRGLPLSQRIEKQYNWQTTRPTLDGKPALLELAAMAGFKHTPNLSYGVGIATSIGLGQNWNNIRFSFEGLGLRSYAQWQWKYGFGAYAGYERVYKKAAFITDQQQPNTELQSLATAHNTATYSESVLIGLTKRYKLNSKWDGSMQLLYDVWWKEKGLRSPIVLRFATLKK